MIGIGIGISFIHRKAGISFIEQYQDVLDRGNDLGFVLPSIEQQKSANQKIALLVDSGIWDEITDLWMPDAGGDSDFACLNYRSPANRALVKVNSPNYTAGLGFAGNGSTSYMTGVHATSQFTINDACMFFHIGNNISTNNMGTGTRDAANRYNAMRFRNSTQWRGWINQHVSTEFSATQSGTTAAFHYLHRTGSSAQQYWYNGSLLASGTAPSQAATPNTPWFGAFNNAGSPNQFTSYRFRKMGYGAALVGFESELYNILTAA